MLTVTLSDLMKCGKYFVPWDHERGSVAFRLVQDMHAALSQEGNTPREGRMAYEIHLETRDRNDRR